MFLNGPAGRLAYRQQPGRDPGLLFLPGFMSDMTGEKATRLGALSASRGHHYVALDYSGHGASDGRIEEGTITRWLADVLAVLDAVCPPRVVLAGSSMGGWLALLAARARPERVAALLGIAAAPDFTERLVWHTLSPGERETMMREGLLRVPSAYGGDQVFSRALIEDGRQHLLLDGPIAIRCPVRLVHGQRDPDVPWETALAIADRLQGPDVRTVLVKDGEHRLSRPSDLALIERLVVELLGENGA